MTNVMILVEISHLKRQMQSLKQDSKEILRMLNDIKMATAEKQAKSLNKKERIGSENNDYIYKEAVKKVVAMIRHETFGAQIAREFINIVAEAVKLNNYELIHNFILDWEATIELEEVFGPGHVPEITKGPVKPLPKEVSLTEFLKKA